MSAIVAFGAISALGEGWDAASAGEIDRSARVAIARDEALASAGLERPFAARVAIGGDGDRATLLVARALAECMKRLDAEKPGWRSLRVGLAIGTSSGGMESAERVFRGVGVTAADVARASYAGPLRESTAAIAMRFEPAALVLGACASSAIAIGLASRWLDEGACDLVLAGGFDAVTTFVASGFEALHATSAQVPPRPFRSGRDGMSLGEGAAVLALVRASDAGNRALAYVAGFGASADAVHVTAPDRTGAGLAKAARAALLDAGSPAIDLVSAHATATSYSDAAESRAIRSLGAAAAVVHAFKAQIGHTLGAAGALESLACVDAMRRGVLPASAGEGAIDPDAPAHLLDRARAGSPRVALKLASAFGGANAALVLSASPPSRVHARARRDVFLGRAVHVPSVPSLADLASALKIPLDRLSRADLHVHLALAAVLALQGSLGGAGIVVGTALATLETNAVYAARVRHRGARFAEPRRFPYTSPNAVAGECGVAFGLTGPSFSVGGGAHAGLEAIAVATSLVRAGDADRVVVVAVDEVGPCARACALDSYRSGAVALLVTSDRASSIARVDRASVSLEPSLEPLATDAPGHLALLPLTAETPPSRVEIASTSLGSLARARIDLTPI